MHKLASVIKPLFTAIVAVLLVGIFAHVSADTAEAGEVPYVHSFIRCPYGSPFQPEECGPETPTIEIHYYLDYDAESSVDLPYNGGNLYETVCQHVEMGSYTPNCVDMPLGNYDGTEKYLWLEIEPDHWWTATMVTDWEDGEGSYSEKCAFYVEDTENYFTSWTHSLAMQQLWFPYTSGTIEGIYKQDLISHCNNF